MNDRCLCWRTDWEKKHMTDFSTQRCKHCGRVVRY